MRIVNLGINSYRITEEYVKESVRKQATKGCLNETI